MFVAHVSASRAEAKRERAREKDASACTRRHQALALPPDVAEAKRGGLIWGHPAPPYLAERAHPEHCLDLEVGLNLASQVGMESNVLMPFIVF
jgi:hypothetical protein